jgi:hypothetical protein
VVCSEVEDHLSLGEQDKRKYQIGFQHTLLIFVALSYCWGEDQMMAKARVMSSPAGKITTLALRLNLALALKHLRQATGPRVLWIDAVCIDQLNISERNHEVRRMGKIYKLAQRVIVWLGSASESSTRGLEVLAALGAVIVQTANHYFLHAPVADRLKYSSSFSEAVQKKMKVFSSSEQIPYNVDDYQAISDIIQRPWWTRLW